MTQPSTYPRQPRRFNCLSCGCEVYRPETDRFDDWICLNCRFGIPSATARQDSGAQ